MAAIRQQINIGAPQRAVWTALTTAEGWASWWCDAARVDAREGGRIVLTGEDPEGKPVEERGIFHEVKPTRRLEIAWDTNSPAATKGTRLQFTISRDGEDTRLALVHSGAGVLDDEEQRTRLDREWKEGLRSLRETLEKASAQGEKPPPPSRPKAEDASS